MRILTVLTYYRPHTSGLTIYAERLAKALVRRGHEVTVLTTQYEPDLDRYEFKDGVKIVRLPIWFRISKGVIAPSFGFVATKMILQHDVVLLHLPQFDAAGVALRGRLFNKPSVLTYHCDIMLPPGIFNRLVNSIVNFMNNIAGFFVNRVIAYTEDFALYSPFLTRFAYKRDIILPPVELPEVEPYEVEKFQRKFNPDERIVIGMATRFASEKGVEILLESLPRIMKSYPKIKVLFAGQYEGVWGEDEYFSRLYPVIRSFQKMGAWEFLGVLNPAQMSAFYQNVDVLVVPSLNSTESFGLVQIEAMMNGVPVVASDLPGVRQPVRITGMGEIHAVGDSKSLAEAILKILQFPKNYLGDPEAVKRKFESDENAAAYEKVFEKLVKGNQ